jgi:predicted transposase YbfD/YdcC
MRMRNLGGRLEQRFYELYDISGEYFESRWDRTNFRSLVVVNRKRMNLKDNSLQEETSYYISNIKVQKNNDYFKAIRSHWEVEVNHYIRDVTLKKDSFRTKDNDISRIFSGLRTLVIEILRLLKPKNIIAQIELFQDNLTKLIGALKMLNIL